jgi:hypothetical protein
MGKPDPPPAPDYAAAAQQQGIQNKETALVQGKINNPNVISPYGTQTTTWGTNFDQAAYDNAMKDYQAQMEAWNQMSGGASGTTNPYYRGMAPPAMPTRAKYTTPIYTPTVEQKFSPEQQKLYNQQVKTQQLLGGLGQQGAESLQGIVGKPVDFSGAPQTGSYDQTRQRVIDAYMGRANEDYAKRTDADRSSLTAAGIPMGSKAYADNQQMIERSRNDAAQQAELAGGNAAAQAYGVDEARRRQAITEQLAQRQTPLNEINAILSGSQVSNPFSMPGYAQNAQVAPPPTYNAFNAAGQYGTDVYNARAAQAGNTQSGLIGLGGTALLAGAMM